MPKLTKMERPTPIKCFAFNGTAYRNRASLTNAVAHVIIDRLDARNWDRVRKLDARQRHDRLHRLIRVAERRVAPIVTALFK